MAGLGRMTDKFTRRGLRVLGVIFLASFCLPVWAADVSVANTPFDQGFRLMYDLEFDRAHQFFSSWQREHPEDPVSPAADAAGLLFSEFERLGVLEAQFYENDKAFNARKKLVPDPGIRDRFNLALDQSQSRARALLEKNPKDRDALFAMTLSSGLRADYAALIEKRNLASMRYTKDSTKWSEQLLAVDPQCYDGHIASGISKYIIGSMAAPVRWIMRLGGVSGDKKAGIAELQLTAQRGRYLAPFARILLAIAFVAFRGPGIFNLVLALSLGGWVGYARLVRAQVLAVREREFVEAARALGANDLRIIVRHILPNIIQPVIVQAAIGMAGAILAEATMSFLGLGVPPPTASWGSMLNDARAHLFDSPYLVLFPATTVMLAVLAFNFIGDALRDFLDPRSRIEAGL